MLLGWKPINEGKKDGIRFVIFVFVKKCSVVGPGCVGVSPPFSFYSHKDSRMASNIPPHWDVNFWVLSPALMIYARFLLVMFINPCLH